MAEVYKKQYTSNTTVLGSYNNGATTKMCFATAYRKQVHLASGKMSKGAEPKFLYKMDLAMKLSELQAMVEALDRCSKGVDALNYHEFGEYTDYKGDTFRLILKNSDFGGLVATKVQSRSLPDEFPDDDPLETCDPDPTPDNHIESAPAVEWSECFEKFYISKNEDWKELGHKLRDCCDELAVEWGDENVVAKPALKIDITDTTPRRQLPATTTSADIVATTEKKGDKRKVTIVADKKAKKVKRSKSVPKEIVSSEGESTGEEVRKPKFMSLCRAVAKKHGLNLVLF
jgi:hypothetical protein